MRYEWWAYQVCPVHETAEGAQTGSVRRVEEKGHSQGKEIAPLLAFSWRLPTVRNPVKWRQRVNNLKSSVFYPRFLISCDETTFYFLSYWKTCWLRSAPLPAASPDIPAPWPQTDLWFPVSSSLSLGQSLQMFESPWRPPGIGGHSWRRWICERHRGGASSLPAPQEP